MADLDVARVVLLSRSGAGDADALTELGDFLAGNGIGLDVMACDVADPAGVSAAVARVEESGPPLRGVVHAAGTVQNQVLDELTWDEFAAVARAKVVGGWNLHEATRGCDLGLFVLFTSISGVWGSGGQGAYAAGNAFLDGLAAYRRCVGLAGTAVAWGPWEGGGMVSDGGTIEHLHRLGLSRITPEIGIAALGRVVAGGDAHAVVADVDWSRLASAFAAAGMERLFEEIPEAGPALRTELRAEPFAGGRAGGLVADLVGRPRVEQERVLVELIREHGAVVLGHGDGAGLDVDRSFRDLGFDSLTAVEFRDRVCAATGASLAASAVFDFPTPQRLAVHVLEELVGAEPAGARVRVAEPQGLDAGGPVAIVGMGCRFPGGVCGPEQLWSLVESGGDAIGPSPGDRGWAVRETGGFLDAAGAFDAGFFGISPREALAMDPQQRLALECSWEALERALIDPASLRGCDAGVFLGVTYSGYQSAVEASREEAARGYGLTGSAPSVASGRVSYALGLEGPAVSVDTACSSSLVALHWAVQALRRGECSLALAGGVTVMATLGAFVEFGRQGGLAADGRCKAFGEGADGTGWSEGAGMLVLEHLSDARRLGHPVLAVVRGSAVNQDGASNGLTAPNGPAQQRVIRQALAGAGVSAAEVDAVEAHGTGTSLGDPIEAQALLATYGADRPGEDPLWLGSVKSNIGHTQAAAGVAGVIKMVEAMRHGRLPKTLHAEVPSPHVDWSAGAVRLLSESRPWERNGRPRRAGVSSFGISGTNAHVLLEQADSAGASGDGTAAPPISPIAAAANADTHFEHPVPLVVSARDGAGLGARAAQLGAPDGPVAELPVVDVAWSLARSRAGLGRRAVVLGSTREELLAGLGAVAGGGTAGNVVRGGGAAGQAPLAVVFSGQGAQWPGMGRDLYARYRVFAAAVDEVCAHFDVLLDGPLREAMFSGESLDETGIAQPALFAFEVGLFRLLESWGITPDYVMGHSVGEFAAAYVAGVWSLRDACAVVAARGRLMQALPAGGAMVSLQATEEEVLPLLEGLADRVGVAAVNGPGSVVVSGDADPVGGIEGTVASWGRKTRWLRVSHAFHSPRMDPMVAEFARALEQVAFHRPELPVVSNLTGELADPELLCSVEYWVSHVRRPVRFGAGVADLVERGVGRFVEVGPDAVLVPAVGEVAPGAVVVGTQRRDRPEAETLLTAVARLYVEGAAVDWPAVITGTHDPTGSSPAGVDLPTYPFQRDHYWLCHDPEPADPVADCRYHVDWRPLPRETGGTGSDRAWLVLAPAHDETVNTTTDEFGNLDEPDTIATRLAETLSARGASVRLLRIGRLDRAHLRERIGEAADALRNRGDGSAYGSGTATGNTEIGCLSLLGTAAGGHPDAPAVHRGLAATAALVQALRDVSLPGPLWCLTRNAVNATTADSPTDPDQAQVRGFGRVAALEHPALVGGLADLPERIGEADFDTLCDLLDGRYRHDQVAVRGTTAYGCRVVQRRAAAPEHHWQPRGTVLVTGGTGALGIEVARWLVLRGADNVLLLSRSGADHAPGLEQELTGSGSSTTAITIARCDVADRDQLAAALAAIPAEHPLTGVIHAAGAGEFRPVDEIGPAELAAVTTAKVRGAQHLHELTRDLPLEVFVLFSSIAAVWGSGAQAGYAAANAHLDALAARRRAQGLPATSIAWGPWAGGGMASEPGAEDALTKRGLALLDPSFAIAGLQRAIDAGDSSVVFADVDWARFLPSFTALRTTALFDELRQARNALETAPGTGTSTGSEPEFQRRLAGLPEPERRQEVLNLVRSRAAAVLGVTDAAHVPDGQAFKELGFDSLTAVEMRDALVSATGAALPASLVFDHPTPSALADHLYREIGGGEQALASQSVLADLDRLRAGLAATDLSATDRLTAERHLNEMLLQLNGRTRPHTAMDDSPDDLSDATDDELFDALDGELGTH
ncbi:SDR family NAD(P)-dependent oxidoreductase [Streptomonospora sediminis]